MTAKYEPLLYRTTITEGSPLLVALKAAGFLETRRVYEPWLHPREVKQPTVSIDGRLELLPLSNLLEQRRQRELLELYIEVYARVSRLDPATPERLTPDEWEEMLLGDPALALNLSCCALVGDRLVGLSTVYNGQQEGHFELGPLGVAEEFLSRHQEIIVAMLACSSAWLHTAGWGAGCLALRSTRTTLGLFTHARSYRSVSEAQR